MASFGGISWGTARTERDLLARRRQEAEARLVRERARSARRALAGCVMVAVLLGLGTHFYLAPAFQKEERLTPAEAAAREFAKTRTGDVRFNSLDGSLCREIQFRNDTGQFFTNRLTRCDSRDENVVVPPVPMDPDPTKRTQAIHDAFQKR